MWSDSGEIDLVQCIGTYSKRRSYIVNFVILESPILVNGDVKSLGKTRVDKNYLNLDPV